MIKKIVSISLIAAFSFAGVKFDKPLSHNKAEQILKKTPFYQKIIQSNTKYNVYDKDNFYVIVLTSPRGKASLYLTKNERYLILGRVIDLKNKKELKVNEKKNITLIKDGIMFTFGKGKKEIYLVTDPQCPFCRRMEKLKKEVLNKNYKVHVILMPLSFHRYAKAMSYYILAGKNDSEKAKRLQEVLSGSNEWQKFKPTKKQIQEFNKKLEAAKKAATELGARGTPSVYDKNFNEINWMNIN